MYINKVSFRFFPVPFPCLVHFSLLPYSFHIISTLGTLVMFHSALAFRILPGSTLSICTASVICRSIASFLNVQVTFIWNSCITPSWTLRQCSNNVKSSRYKLDKQTMFPLQGLKFYSVPVYWSTKNIFLVSAFKVPCRRMGL